MINEGIELLQKLFTTTVGLETTDDNNDEPLTIPRKEDLSAIDVFYASTASTIVSSSTKDKPENSMTFLVDKQKLDEEVKRRHQKRDEEALKAAREKEEYEYRESLKQHIDQIMDEPETQPLARYLHRHIREKATIERMRTNEEMTNKARVYYVSFSFLIDGIYPIIEGLHKKKHIRRLRQSFFHRIPNLETISWEEDANKSIVGTIFAPVRMSSLYEDNLQRLFLLPPYDIKETQKLNPRGVLLANMATFAHDHDPLVEVGTAPTTLRGLFSNVLDGSIYKGLTISSIKAPFEVSDLFDGADLKTYCDRLLRCSYYAVLLTFLGVKAWLAERYPEDRFVVNSEGFVTIKLPYNEVIHEDGMWWIYNDKKRKTICFTGSFETLLSNIMTII